MIYDSGSTSRSVDLQVVDDAGLGVTGLVAATFPPMVYSLGGANADVSFPSLSDLDTITTAWAAGGVKERTNGWYRVDLPDGVFTTAGVVTVRGDASGKHVILEPLDIAPPVNATRLSGTAQTARDIGDSVLLSSGTGTGQVSLSSGAVLLQATQTGVTIPNVTTVGSVTGNVGGNVTGTVASVVGNVGGNVVGTVGSVIGAVGSVAGAVGSVTGNVGGNVVGSVALVSGSVASVVGSVGSVSSAVTIANAADVTAIKTKTDQLTFTVANSVDATATVDTSDIADDVLTTQITESYAADGVAPTLAQAIMMLLQRQFDVAISGTTMTVKRLDGSTTAATLTLNSSTAPTSIARAT
jgi:hypothetical protein